LPRFPDPNKSKEQDSAIWLLLGIENDTISVTMTDRESKIVLAWCGNGENHLVGFSQKTSTGGDR